MANKKKKGGKTAARSLTTKQKSKDSNFTSLTPPVNLLKG